MNLRRINYLIFFILIILFFFGYFVGFYNDEYAFITLKSKFLGNNWQVPYILSACQNNFFYSPPLAWYPAGIFFGIFFDYHNWFFLRSASILLACISTASFLKSIKNYFDDKTSHILICVFLISFSLGVVPLILVIWRPELWMITIFSIIFWASLNPKIREYNFPQRFLLLILYVFLSSLFYYSAPKSLYFTPFWVVVAFIIFHRSFLLLAIGFSWLFFASWGTFQDALNTLNCFNIPVVHSSLSAMKPQINMILLPWSELLNFVLGNIKWSIDSILVHVEFQNNFQSRWLYSVSYYFDVIYINKLINIFYFILFYCALWLPFISIVNIIRGRASKFALLSLSLYPGYFFMLAFGAAWNFYTASLIIYLAVILNISSVSSLKLSLYCPRSIKIFIEFFAIILVTLSFIFNAIYVIPTQYSSGLRNNFEFNDIPKSNSDNSNFLGLRDCQSMATRGSPVIVDKYVYGLMNNISKPIDLNAVDLSWLGADSITFFKNFHVGLPKILYQCGRPTIGISSFGFFEDYNNKHICCINFDLTH